MKLRPFQINLNNQGRKALEEGYRKILFVAPTGSGKTHLYMDIAARAQKLGNRVLITTHRRKLLEQNLQKFFDNGIQAGQIAAGRPMTRDMIQIGMVQTISRRLKQIKKPDLLLFDEGHHYQAETYIKIAETFPDVPYIGFTATPLGPGNKNLGDRYEIMIKGPSTKWMVENGYLTKPIMYRPDREINEQFKIKRGEFDREEQEQFYSNKVIVGNTIEQYRKHLNYKKTIIFCVSIKHCEIVADMFCQAGYMSVAVHGKMKEQNLKAAFAGFESGDIPVITCCDLIGEGIDIPECTGVILLRRTTSLSLFLQWCGRPERLFPGKDVCYILDQAGNFFLWGHPLHEWEWSLDMEKIKAKKDRAPTTTECPKCQGVWPGKPKICPGWIGNEKCNFNFAKKEENKEEKRKLPKAIEGDLVEALPEATNQEIEGLKNDILKMQQMTPAERQKFMIKKAKELQDRKKIKILSDAIGYNGRWTFTIWTQVLGNRW